MKSKSLFLPLLCGLLWQNPAHACGRPEKLPLPLFSSLNAASAKSCPEGFRILSPVVATPSVPKQPDARVSAPRTRDWIWFGVFLGLSALFLYLSFASFALVNTAEVSVGFFKVARWLFLGLGLFSLGWSIRHLVRALRKNRKR